ncbi:Ig-like domain-containing protein [Candidatus Palauibacter sp.]|uniref:Ig-like domain-containing protein n=1 Tax=Candidatus Palauibacter sp. TaxID=3101350 RepID=UPI003B0128E1
MSPVIATVVLLLASAAPAPAAGDDGPAPRQSADTVSVTLAAPAGGTVAEGDTAHFEVGVTGNTGTEAVTVQYAVSGTAKRGADYAELSGEVTVAAGETSALIAVATVADEVDDDGETVTIALTGATGPGTVRLRARPETVRITDGAGPRSNRPPLADAGSSQTVDERTVVNLDGSASEDPDDDPLSFSWSQTAGPDAGLLGANTEYPSFAAPEVDSTTTLRFQLRVSDGQSNSYASTSVTVNDVPPPPAPLACNMDPDQLKVEVNETGTSEVDCTGGAGKKTHGAPTSSNSAVATATRSGTTVTVTGDSVGTATVSVIVTDDTGSSTASVAVTVVRPNRAPVCTHIGPQEVLVGGSGSVACTDLDRDSVQHTRVRSSNESVVSASGGEDVTFTGVSAGRATVSLEARDGRGGITEHSFDVTVVRPNRAPVCTHIGPQEVLVGGSGSVACTDLDRDSVQHTRVRSSNESVVSASGGEDVTFTGVSAGRATVSLEARDGRGGITEHSFAVTVVRPNRAPVCTHIGPQEVLVGGSGSVACTDLDRDSVQHTRVRSSNESVVSASGGEDVTFTGVSAGRATVSLEARDGRGGITGHSFDVTVVRPNRAPVCTHIGPQEVLVGGSGSVACTDLDRDSVQHTRVRSSNESVVSASGGEDVTFTGVSAGRATVSLEARDGRGGITEHSFDVTVVRPNRAPVCTHIGPQEVLVGGSGSVACTDPDGDRVEHTRVTSSNESVVSASGGEDVTFTGVSAGRATVSLEARDGRGGITGHSFDVTVVRPNRAPVCTHIGPQEVLVGGSGSVACTDPDGDRVEHTRVTSSNESVVSASGGEDVTFTGVSAGRATVSLEARDGRGGITEHSFDVTVTHGFPPNGRPPEAVGTIRSRSVDVGQSGAVTVSRHFTDPDDDALSYAATSSNRRVATVSVSDSVVTYTGVSVGGASVTVTATDPWGLRASQTFAVTVTPSNRPPVAVGEIGADTLYAGTSRRVEVSGKFSDADDDALTYTAESDSAHVVTVAVEGSVVAYRAVVPGSAEVTVTASDGQTSVEQRFRVTVPNRAPAPAGSIGDQETYRNGTGSVDVSSYFSDADGEALTYAASTSDGSVVTVGVSGGSVTFGGEALGEAEVTVTASDRQGAMAAQRFTVRVVNRAPVSVDSIAAQSVELGGRGTVEVSGDFEDADNDRLTYTASTSDASVVTVEVAGSEVGFTGVARGSASVTVTASDGHGGSAAQVFTVTVANRAPAAVGEIGGRTVEAGSSGQVDASSYFSDADGDELTHAASSSDESVATVRVDGGEVEYTGVSRGLAEVTVTADDGYGGRAEQVFAVTVPNRAPAAAEPIAGQSVEAGSSARVDVTGHFADPDGDELTYVATTSDASVATVLVDAGEVVLTGVSRGEAEVTVTASDDHGGSAARVFAVTVLNRAPAVVGEIEGRTVEADSSGRVAVSGHFEDADGDELTYAATTSDASVVTVAVEGSEVVYTGVAGGEAEVTVRASDGHGGSAAQVFTVTVTLPNLPPTAHAGRDQERNERVLVVLYGGRSSDPNGDELSYAWRQTSGPAPRVLLQPTTVSPRFPSPEVDSAMVLVFELVVSDGEFDSAPDTVAVTVRNVNRAPRPSGSIPGDSVYVGASGRVDVSSYFRDADGETLTYAASADPAVVTVAVEGNEVAYAGVGVGSAEVTVTATDVHGGIAAQRFTVTVPNQAPETAGAFEAQSVGVGGSGSVEVSGHFTDPDNDPLTYTASSSDSSVVTVDVRGSEVALTGESPGEAEVTVTAADGHGGTAAQVFAVTVRAPNRAPVFSPDAVSRAVAENSGAGTAVGEPVTATDPDADDLTYSFPAGGDEAAFGIDETTGQITVGGSTVLDYESGDTEFTVLVVASDGALSDTAAVTIRVTNAEEPGTVTLDRSEAEVGAELTATLADEDGADAAATSYTWQQSADGGATWKDIPGATAATYMPAAADEGQLVRAVFTYTDGHGPGKRAESAAVRVRPANRPPEFSAAAVARAVAENSGAGTAVGEPVTATDPDADELSYGFLAGGDEAAFDIDGSTGQITVGGAAALDYESGTTEFTVEVVASDGTLSDTAAVTVTVTDADDPGVVRLDAGAARVGMRIAATLMDQDGSQSAGKTRQWQLSADGSTGWTDISGAASRFYTPVAGDQGMWLRAVFSYTDGDGPNKRAESAAVRVTGPNAAPVFNPAAVALSVAENSAAGTDVGVVTATDGNDDELRYRFAAGGDAASFEIDGATGRITVGSPAALDYESDTELTADVVASDGMLADTAAVTIRVTDADDPGVLTLDAAVARVGAELTATLVDEDGADAGTTTRVWQRSSDDGATWTDIAGANSEFYIPASADEGMLLRAVFSYTDGHGPNKRAESDAVRVTGSNRAPVFSPDALARTVAENSGAGTAVGEPVTATDSDDDELTYRLAAGGNAASFEIDASTGRITVGSAAALDYESGNTSLTVQVIASDGMLADTAAVTISVTDADDPGMVTLDATLARVGVQLTAVLMDQDGSRSAGKRRRWQRSADGGTTWSNIAGATSRFYTPPPGDEGQFVRAVFTYTDGHGPGKRAESAAVPVVGAATPVLSFGAEAYPVPLGGSADVVVTVSPPATASLTVGVTVGGAASETTHTVTFGTGETEQTLAVSAAGLAAGDTVVVTFGTLPAGAVTDAASAARVIVSEAGADMRQRRVVPLVVEYGEPSYTAAAGGAAAAVTVRVSPAADREVVVPVTMTGAGAGALGPEELGVPAALRFAAGDTVRTFTVEAPAEAPGGQFTLGFGTLPEGVSAGPVAASAVAIAGRDADAALFDESMDVGLAVLGRSVAESARRTIGGRMEAAMRGGAAGGSAAGSAGEWAARALASIAGPRPDGRTAGATSPRPGGAEALRRLLPRLSFSTAVGGAGQQVAAPRFSVWGEGSAQGFRGEPGGVSYEGGMRALTVGADARLGTGARLGVSVMRSGGEFDYANGSLEGTLEHGMTTVHPYLFFQPSAGLGLWAMAGYGTGQVEAAEAGHAMDATLGMVSGGARVPLMRTGGFGLGLTGDVFGVRMSAGDDGAEGGATRGRALLEATWAANGLRLGAQAGGRYDGGDADTGAGAETGGSVAYTGSALDLALNGRMAFGSGGHREWGVALRLAWDPGVRGQGLRFAVSPGRGHDRSGMQGLLENGHVARGGTAREQASRVDAELGYGLAAFGGGSLDTYGRLSARDGARSWTLGAGYDLASALRFTLEAVRAQNGHAPLRQGIRAGLDFRF